jgi:hypothetical protein
MADNWLLVAVFSSLSVSLANVIGEQYDLEMACFYDTFDAVYASRWAFVTHTKQTSVSFFCFVFVDRWYLDNVEPVEGEIRFCLRVL